MFGFLSFGVLPGFEFKAAGWAGDDDFHADASGGSYSAPDPYAYDFDWSAYDTATAPPSPPE